jgi:hypothetical protein
MGPQPPAVVPITRDAAMAAKNLCNVQHRGLGWALFIYVKVYLYRSIYTYTYNSISIYNVQHRGLGWALFIYVKVYLYISIYTYMYNSISIYNVQHRGLGWALFVAYSYYMIQFHGIQNLPVDEVGTVSTLGTHTGGTPGTHTGYSGYSRRGTLHDPVPRHPEPARRRGGVDTPERTRASAPTDGF